MSIIVALFILYTGIKMVKETASPLIGGAPDKDMIENAGLGVIMGNSAEYMHKFADVVAPTNNDDGVAEILEKYL